MSVLICCGKRQHSITSREQMAGGLTVFSGRPKLGYFGAAAIHHQRAAWVEAAARHRATDLFIRFNP
jgi:hypothetical protein